MSLDFSLILAFVFGTIVGSFLNVVIYRYGTGFSILNGRSGCFSCGKQLSWFELIPVVSFIFLRGKCAACKSKISFQYLVVELVSGALFATIFAKITADGFNLPLLVLYLSTFSVLLVITVYDLRHKIIPDGLVALFILLSLAVAILNFYHNSYLITLASIMNLGAGLILFLPFYGLWKVSNGRWIGLGDGKLAIGIGTLLGLPEGLSAIVIGFWIGAVMAGLLLLFQKYMHNIPLWGGQFHLTMKSEIPFAPFLILGTIIIFFFPFDIFSLHLLLGL